mmetsp:Transcript_57560/g.122425  ORF Transcript_57560/g.122425 Transcript_57560/m.122425 type:complete len:133 (-) Transcript_57560:88-486(-)
MADGLPRIQSKTGSLNGSARSASLPNLTPTAQQGALLPKGATTGEASGSSQYSPWRKGPQAIYQSRNRSYGAFYDTYVLDSKRLYSSPIKANSEFSKHLGHCGFWRNSSIETRVIPDFEKCKGTKEWPNYLL